MYTRYSLLDMHNFHTRYLMEFILYQILTSVQIILILSTIYKFYIKPNTDTDEKEKHHINRHIKCQFMLVMLLGSLIFFMIEWNGIADTFFDFASVPHYCSIASILGNIVLITYLLVLYLFYLYRLCATFKNSALQISPKTIHILLIITFVTYAIMLLLVSVLQRAAPIHTPFSWSSHIQDTQMTICDGEFSIAIHPVIRVSLQFIVVIGNTFYGWIFWRKLYNLINFSAHTPNAPSAGGSSGVSSKNAVQRLQSIYRLMNK
eukprot:329555_1